MPSLEKLNNKSKPKDSAKEEPEPEPEFKGPFFQVIANEYNLTDKAFFIAYADTIESTLPELEKLMEEQVDAADGFLDPWGALFTLGKKLNIKVNVLHKNCIAASNDKKNLKKVPAAAAKKKAASKKKTTAEKKNSTLKKKSAAATKEKKKPTLKKDFKEKAKKDFEKGLEKDAEPGPKKKPLKVKAAAPSTVKAVPRKDRKRCHICLFNGGEGSGKSRAAVEFPKPFILDLEDKLFDLIDYSDDFDFQEGVIGPIEAKERDIAGTNKVEAYLCATGIKPEDDYVVGKVMDEQGNIDYLKTNDNTEAVIEWFRESGWQNYETFVIDVGKMVRDASIRTEEINKGRQLGQFEYIPITKRNKKLIEPLIYFCRKRGINLVIVSHWSGIYETRKNAQGFDTNVKVGKEPDVKEWIRDLITWRIDFLKPNESGFDEKFIVDFQKAPGEQYFKLDITDKTLFDIISDPKNLSAEKEVFRQLKRKQHLAEKEGKK